MIGTVTDKASGVAGRPYRGRRVNDGGGWVGCEELAPSGLGIVKRCGGLQESVDSGEEFGRSRFVWVVAGAGNLDKVGIGQLACDGPVVVGRDGPVPAAPGDQDGQVAEQPKLPGGADGLSPPVDHAAGGADERLSLPGIGESAKSFGDGAGVLPSDESGQHRHDRQEPTGEAAG